MRIEYEGLDGLTYAEDLTPCEVRGLLLHSTPDENVPSILKQGIKCGMPKTKLMIDILALFCSIPSAQPNTKDLFRYYDDWSVIVIDTDKLPGHLWFLDFIASDEAANSGRPNNHILTFQDIPAAAIKKVLKPSLSLGKSQLEPLE